MVIKQRLLCLEKCVGREQCLKLVKVFVCVGCSLIKLLAAVGVENQGHEILWQTIHDLFQL